MNFIIDAQLPRRLAHILQQLGHDTVHAINLPKGNTTPDGQILDVSEQEQRVVTTKGADFVDSHLLTGQPAKPLLISTGNISNPALEAIILPALPQIMMVLTAQSYVELTRTRLIIHA